MQVIPLFKEVEVSKDNVKDLEVSIPSEWWNTSYSFNYSTKVAPPIYKFKKREARKFQIASGWDVNKGDYRVQESRANTHDYVYYRNLKIKMLKYSVYPVVIFTVLLILKLSDILSKI